MRLSDIYIRDPFVLEENGVYYLYGTMGKYSWEGGCGFDVYVSRDRKEWSDPVPVFRPEAGFWADKNFWAPEVHKYRDSFVMLASFYREGAMRATHILRADSPMGPFVPVSPEPQTPAGWMCLDGTLHVDEQGKPWMVFCHEWLQVTDGEICALSLREDLTRAAGEPVLLFRASQAAWTINGKMGEYITDGPFLYRKADGELLMLWSSFGRTGYALAVAHSRSGSVLGPWVNEEKPLFSCNGGHGMLFRDRRGVLTLSLHQPDHPYGLERPAFIPVKESRERGLELMETYPEPLCLEA